MASVIFPAGGKRYDWIPKLAEDEKIGVEAMSDEEISDLVAPVDVDVEEALVGEPGEEPEIDAVEVTVEGEIPEEGELEGEEEAPATVEEAAEEAAEILEEAQDAIQDVIELAIGEDGEIEFEDEAEEIAEEVDADLEGDLESETPGEPIEEELEKETGQMCGEALPVKAKADSEGESVEAESEKSITVAESGGAGRRFVKVAALTPENKKKVRDYWVNILGYDPKYVEYMVTDYEK